METGNTPKEIIVVCGPTAVGKTSFAIELAEAVGGEIISADSMQVYRYMDIGTAKPTADEKRRVPHHLIDVADPDENFDAERFSHSASAAIDAIRARGKTPVVAGGTGLYIRALVFGLFPAPPSDPRIRERLKREAEALGIRTLHERLSAIDPEAAGRIDPNDSHRTLRALEVHRLTGRPITEFHGAHGFAEPRYRVLTLGLDMDRTRLYHRIERRVDRMMETGLVDEVRHLLARGYSPDLKSMRSIGYRHMAAHIRGEITREEAVRTLKRDTRRYAKRQMTWFRAEKKTFWTAPDRPADACRMAVAFLNADE